MRHVVVTMRAHADLTKLEFEDGLLRQIIPERLDIESSLFGIDVDLRAENQTPLGAPDADAVPAAILTFSALDHTDLTAAALSEMVIDVATPTAAYLTDAETIGEEGERWVGRATPGTKLIVFLERPSGLDRAGFDGWLDGVAAELGDSAGPGHVVVHRVIDTLLPSPDVDAIVTVRFPSTADLTAAEESDLPALLGEAAGTDGARRLLAFEHRFSADPNHWGATNSSPPSVA